MAAEIEKIFMATARSTWQFMIEAGQGCYIPAYQRPYSWDQDNIARLNEDVLHGIRQLADRPATISFIGTIIAIHDTRYRTVEPIFRSEVANRVMTIIDGQQRLCTIVMSNMALHDFVRRLAPRFEGKPEPEFAWLYDQATQLLADLRNTYLIDRAGGDDNYRFYPRVIRAYLDVWSRRQGQARYESPIAKLIWGYIDHTEKGTKASYKFKPVDEAKKPIQQYSAISDAFQNIRREIQRICETNYEERDFPNLVSATQSADFADAIWGFDVSEDVKRYLAERSSDVSYAKYCALLRAIIFAKYLNDRVAITIVTTDNEDDAFDMFEALNTTGEPLTAFETFKPKVIDVETLSKYEHSPSRKSVGHIETYLDRFKKADEKQKATSELLVPFALAETGTKLQKRLNDQRRYLRDEFDNLTKTGDIEKNRAFVATLAAVARFMHGGWDVEKGSAPSFNPLVVTDEEAIIGFEALRNLNHSITIAPLVRFYQYALDGEDAQEREERTKEFVSAIKATIAFSMLWRGAKGGTENIDSHYRDVMRTGISRSEESIPPLARRVEGKLGALSLPNYKRALRLVLEDRGQITSKDEWVKAASRIPIYRHSSTVARFLIFCASDNALPDPANNGLIIRGRDGVAPMFSAAVWRDENYYTVEHIAPQNTAGGWVGDIYEAPETVHQLGNLTLLPIEENGVVANKSWQHKKVMYGLLSAATQTEYDNMSQKAKEVGLTLSRKAADVLSRSKYLGLCKSLSLCEREWTKSLIEERSKLLAGLAWDRIEGWL